MTSKGANWQARIKNQVLKISELRPTFQILRWARRGRMPPIQ